ncbi:hypothetical protein S83_069783 [Arachis hypogaea]
MPDQLLVHVTLGAIMPKHQDEYSLHAQVLELVSSSVSHNSLLYVPLEFGTRSQWQRLTERTSIAAQGSLWLEVRKASQQCSRPILGSAPECVPDPPFQHDKTKIVSAASSLIRSWEEIAWSHHHGR